MTVLTLLSSFGWQVDLFAAAPTEAEDAAAANRVAATTPAEKRAPQQSATTSGTAAKSEVRLPAKHALPLCFVTLCCLSRSLCFWLLRCHALGVPNALARWC